MTTALFAHADQLATDIAALVARQTKPMRPRGTSRMAVNADCYGSTQTISITHRQPDGRCKTIQVIASTYVAAEIAALDQISFSGH